MNNKAICVLAFLTGAAVGTAATWQIFKTKYKKIADEEIESVKEYYSNKKKDPVEETKEESVEQETEKKAYSDYASVVKNEYNHSAAETKEEANVGIVTNPTHVHVIPPESAGEQDYDISSLTYYSDGVLVDDADDIVEDVDELVGRESLTHFGEFEDDSVFVRNDKLKTDFEILRDLRSYSDAFSRTSHLVEDKCEDE